MHMKQWKRTLNITKHLRQIIIKNYSRSAFDRDSVTTSPPWVAAGREGDGGEVSTAGLPVGYPPWAWAVG